MPAPTGDQWVRLYRGLQGVTHDTFNPRETGVHWTDDRAIAGYASGGAYRPTGSEPVDERHGMVIEALVHKKHIIPRDSDEWKDIAGSLKVDDFKYEREYTLRRGAPVEVQSIEDSHPDDKRVRDPLYRDQLPGLKRIRA